MDRRVRRRILRVRPSDQRHRCLDRVFTGVEFREAFARRFDVEIDSLQIPVISLADLLTNKRASGRTKDLADAEELEKYL